MRADLFLSIAVSTAACRRFMGSGMFKVLSALVVLAMIVQIIRPLGLPGLTRRADFWKIALAGLALMMLTILLREAAGLMFGTGAQPDAPA